jgi:hypothetical protein
MNKFLTGIAILSAIALPALAGMDSVTYSIDAAGLTTNTSVYVIRGIIESVYVDAPELGTATVSLATSHGTIFTKSCGATDAQYFPRAAAHTTAGAALTWTEAIAGQTGPGTNTITTTRFYEKIGVAGVVTCTVNQTATGGTASQNTNSWAISVLFNK